MTQETGKTISTRDSLQYSIASSHGVIKISTKLLTPNEIICQHDKYEHNTARLVCWRIFHENYKSSWMNTNWQAPNHEFHRPQSKPDWRLLQQLLDLLSKILVFLNKWTRPFGGNLGEFHYWVPASKPTIFGCTRHLPTLRTYPQAAMVSYGVEIS